MDECSRLKGDDGLESTTAVFRGIMRSGLSVEKTVYGIGFISLKLPVLEVCFGATITDVGVTA